MISTDDRVAVLPGSAGVVIRRSDDVLVIGGRSVSVAAAVAALGIEQPGTPARSELVGRLRMLQDVDVAAIVSSPDGFDVVTVGNGSVSTPDGGAPEPNSPVVWVGIGPVPTDVAARLEATPHLDLKDGSVPGQGALIEATVTDAAPSFDIVDFSAPAPTDPRAPLPVADGDPAASEPAPPDTPPRADLDGPLSVGSGIEVMGIRCSREHFNNPRAAYCQVCGISMVHVTHYLVPGQRPTLGFLVFDDGSTFALDRSYCVGREPAPDPERGLAPLVLRDERHSVSRSHAELVLDGWDLVVHDLGSTNGTFVWNTEFQQWNRVMAGQPVVVEPGTSVAIGRKIFVYEAVARPV